MNTIGSLDLLGRHLGLALRAMRRRPAFTLAVMLTLALGIGTTTAIFSIVDGVLIKPLPYWDAGELVSPCHTAPRLQSDLRRRARHPTRGSRAGQPSAGSARGGRQSHRDADCGMN
jgi:hypothetical protein